MKSYIYVWLLIVIPTSLTFSQPTVVFSDNFDRPNSPSVGNGWREIEVGAEDARIRNNRLGFPTADAGVILRPLEISNNITLTWTYSKSTFTSDRDGVNIRYNGRDRTIISEGLALVISLTGQVAIWEDSRAIALTELTFQESRDYNFQWDVFSDNGMQVWVWETGSQPPQSPQLEVEAFEPLASLGRNLGLGNRYGANFDDLIIVTPTQPPPGGDEQRITFRRGDSNADGTLDIADAIDIANHFIASSLPQCAVSADANDDTNINLMDTLEILHFLFLGGPQIPPPFPQCDEHSTENLDCQTSNCQ